MPQIFTIFDANGYTLQSGASLSDLFGDPTVQTQCPDPALCMTLIEEGKQKRVVSLERAITDYVDVAQRDVRVAAMHEEAARTTEAANWLGALPLPDQSLPEPEPEITPVPEVEPEPDIVTEREPAP